MLSFKFRAPGNTKSLTLLTSLIFFILLISPAQSSSYADDCIRIAGWRVGLSKVPTDQNAWRICDAAYQSYPYNDDVNYALLRIEDKSGRDDTMLPRIKALAERGNYIGLYFLGKFHQEGRLGMSINCDRALDLFERAQKAAQRERPSTKRNAIFDGAQGAINYINYYWKRSGC